MAGSIFAENFPALRALNPGCKLIVEPETKIQSPVGSTTKSPYGGGATAFPARIDVRAAKNAVVLTT